MAKKERFRIIPSVYALFIKDNKILLLRRYQTGFEDGNYGLPAGHAESGETFTAALSREVSEEVGIRLDPNNLNLILTMHRQCGDHERADFFFLVSAWQGEAKNLEPNKCDDLVWFPLDQLPQNTIDYIRAAIDCYRKGEKYCEFGWER